VVTVQLDYINLEQFFSFKTKKEKVCFLPQLLALLANNNANYDDL